MTEPFMDVRQLAHGLRQIAATLRASGKGLEHGPVVGGHLEGRPACGLVLKRTYRVEKGGVCVLAPPDKQNPMVFEDVPYGKVELPQVSPLIATSEAFPFRPAVDVVVQGFACAYDDKTTRTTVRTRFGDVDRSIVAHGDRVAELDGRGRIRFGEAKPFRFVPLRWDRAYGGVDPVGFARHGQKMVPFLERVPPEALEMTPYHYARNPCGRGFLLDLDETFEGQLLPNLEHAFDPLMPERLAVGTVDDWMKGPLPAAWDFVDLAWFPRSAYLGLAPRWNRGLVAREIERGWAASDLQTIPSMLHATDPTQVRTEWMQAAAPGMSFPHLAPDTRFTFENLHPRAPVHSVQLPGEVPQATIDLGGPSPTAMVSRMSAVVHRVPLNEVEVLWACLAPLPDGFEGDRALEAEQRVTWQRPRETR